MLFLDLILMFSEKHADSSFAGESNKEPNQELEEKNTELRIIPIEVTKLFLHMGPHTLKFFKVK